MDKIIIQKNNTGVYMREHSFRYSRKDETDKVVEMYKFKFRGQVVRVR